MKRNNYTILSPFLPQNASEGLVARQYLCLIEKMGLHTKILANGIAHLDIRAVIQFFQA